MSTAEVRRQGLNLLHDSDRLAELLDLTVNSWHSRLVHYTSKVGGLQEGQRSARLNAQRESESVLTASRAMMGWCHTFGWYEIP